MVNTIIVWIFFWGLLFGWYLMLEDKKNKKIFKIAMIFLFILMIFSDLDSDCEVVRTGWFRDGCK